MSEMIDMQDMAASLSVPYAVTRSKLGSTTKVIDDKFICTPKEIAILHDSIGEKLKQFQPTKAGFQYLVSFTDCTHYENNKLQLIEEMLSSSSKKTEKLILNWVIAHEYDQVENEMSITVRISNPMNPFAMLQAMLSKDHSDMDRLDFEDGCVSISINGATQSSAEEIFSIVSRWAAGCPQPQSITGINKLITKNFSKIEFLNYWVFPALFIVASYFYLIKLPVETVQAHGIVLFSLFIYVRSASKKFNNKIERWCMTSRRFSLFLVTGGDSNQQTEISAKSRNSMIKLVSSVVSSFLLNIAAGYVIYLFTSL